MNGSDAVEYTKAVDGPPEDSLVLPLKSMSKSRIDEVTEVFLMDALNYFSAAELYTWAKQIESVAEYLKAKLKTQAFDSIAESFGGSMAGEILGHSVKLSLPKRWTYPEAITKLAEKQKAELKAAQLLEQASGAAYQTKDEGRITVTIKGE